MQLLNFNLSVIFLAIYLILSPGLLFGGENLRLFEIPSSFNPVGSGARALGMGGAFIAVADDATAASWNPAGLIQLETPEMSAVGSFSCRKENLSFGTNPEASGKENISISDINYMSIAYPFQVKGYNMIVSLNHQHLYDLSRKWSFPLYYSEDNVVINDNVKSDQSGSLSALGFTWCVQLTPNVSFGATLNTWENIFGLNGWRSSNSQQGTEIIGDNNWSYDFSSQEKVSFRGYNANLGFLWRLNNRLTIGIVYKTSFKADLDYHYNVTFTSIEPVAKDGDQEHQSWQNGVEENRELTMPESYGIGFAYRFSDNFTASLDLYKTEWEDFILHIPGQGDFSPISGKIADSSDVDSTCQVRAGGEYLLINDTYTIAMRGGLFYDPAPAEGHPDNYFGFSLGTGVAYKSMTFDLAYQFRYGNDVGSSLMQGLDFSQDTREHTVYLSTIFHF